MSGQLNVEDRMVAATAKVGRLATAVPITPGGVGVVELTYIAGLVLAGGSPIRARRSPLPRCFGC
jgi:uncharacterized membrane protein YbhN (UPF0104 family)